MATALFPLVTALFPLVTALFPGVTDLSHERCHLQRQLLADGEESPVHLLVHLVGQEEALPLRLPLGLASETQPGRKRSA